MSQCTPSAHGGCRRASVSVRSILGVLTALWTLAGAAQAAEGAAAAGGSASAMPATAAGAPADGARLTEMGKFFEQSEPPSQDFLKARDLYCRAAVIGHPEALQRLGWLYFKGHGVAINEQVAGTLFKWAADLGNERAYGLSRALATSIEVAPPCLAQSGLSTFEALRVRQIAAANSLRQASGDTPNAVVANPVQFSATPAPLERRRLVDIVLQEARVFRLDPRLVLAVIRAESNFDPAARSPRNAQGLMQLIPETALRFNVQDAFDPAENIRGGMAYLRWLLAYYRGDVPLALAAYNAGEGAVDRFRGVPPFAETIAYVQRIRAHYPFDRHPFDVAVLTAAERSWIGHRIASADR